MDNRKQITEENYRRKFADIGLTDQFEFIGFEKKDRLWFKCKKCGKVTQRGNDIFKGRQQKLICRACGNGSILYSPFVDEVLAYYSKKHTVKETCEKFKVSKSKLNNWVRARGVTNGRTISEINAEKARIGADKNIKQAEQRLKNKAIEYGFEYIGGYTRTDSFIQVKCMTCGETLTKSEQCFRKGVPFCPICKKSKIEKKKAEAEKLKAIKTEKREAKLKAAQAERKAKTIKFDTVYICKECGKEYTPRDYMESKGLKLFSNPGFCCAGCQNRFSRRKARNNQKAKGTYSRDTHRARCRRYGCPYDPSVTLKKLIERDGYFCAICGLICNPDDRGWTKYLGPMSPTMDHIIPLAQKGSPGHVWSNVQVAHAMCNSCKSDKVRREDGKYATNKKSRRAKVKE